MSSSKSVPAPAVTEIRAAVSSTSSRLDEHSGIYGGLPKSLVDAVDRLDRLVGPDGAVPPTADAMSAVEHAARAVGREARAFQDVAHDEPEYASLYADLVEIDADMARVGDVAAGLARGAGPVRGEGTGLPEPGVLDPREVIVALSADADRFLGEAGNRALVTDSFASAVGSLADAVRPGSDRPFTSGELAAVHHAALEVRRGVPAVVGALDDGPGHDGFKAAVEGVGRGMDGILAETRCLDVVVDRNAIPVDASYADVAGGVHRTLDAVSSRDLPDGLRENDLVASAVGHLEEISGRLDDRSADRMLAVDSDAVYTSALRIYEACATHYGASVDDVRDRCMETARALHAVSGPDAGIARRENHRSDPDLPPPSPVSPPAPDDPSVPRAGASSRLSAASAAGSPDSVSEARSQGRASASSVPAPRRGGDVAGGGSSVRSRASGPGRDV